MISLDRLDKSPEMRDCRNVSETLAEYVVGQLNSAMGRRRISAMELARRMGKSDDWVGRRRNGDTAISMRDLELFAAALDFPLAYFLPAAERVA